jgi:hypothetical protein
VDGDKLDYFGDVATSTADITTFNFYNQQRTFHKGRCYDDDGR